ncbi:MAG: homocysteine S-methyltransferase family protein, partial [Lachnospiraceae bacterium]|nr:homocysteine S-methyltransferase family protein [Lachnospiraceae bacterium]
EKAVELFGEVVRYGAAAGADLVLIETMSDTYEAKAAILAAKENCDLPVCITVTFDESGKLLTGGTVDVVVPLLEGLGVDALGMNCGLGPQQMIPIVRRMLEISSLPVIVNPNAGLPRTEHGKTVFDIGPEEFAGYMKEIAQMGAHVLGGCCGTTPDHIRRLIEATEKIPVCQPVPKHRTVVTSFSKAVEIGNKPVVIGERINPTGKKKFQAALREHNIDYILGQGIEQEQSGAQILDVNVGLPDIDEPAMMREVVIGLQSISGLPLQIDTSDPVALETALRYYNGKPMINSVNGKPEAIETVMPLVKKYGGVLVGLALDQNGIPETAEGRLEIAGKIYEAADSYGIDRCDIVIDGLAMAVSSDSRGALTTLETIGRVHREMNGHTILGVSNISFGLPRREIINSTFLVMALQEGLSCAIINPNNEPMMRAVKAFCALSDLDPQFETYIGSYAGTKADLTVQSQPSGTAEAAPKEQEAGLGSFVERGLSERACTAARDALTHRDPLELIDQELIPALDRVGKGFEKGTLYLPQLLMAAEAAQAAFGVIREHFQGSETHTKGRVILATVKNDIHDIGKNIVKVMMENYGYEVIDLGKDVDPETIVECAIKEDVDLVGLSALMTTTVVSMEETIKLMRKKKPATKVAVGGAVMTQEYADQIGADFYSKDAMGLVRYADSLFG